ncbi:MAG: N-6 DNA methylase, partial [Lentisphaeria bacterium]|nr:N-6 DNA methylase [Lentisphaeria bacterium]
AYYRTEEKLVYKFISPRPVFAYDNTGSLFLNSANILIPRIPEISIKSLLAILNSKVLAFYYSVNFGDLKILKNNLQTLPLPALTAEKDRWMSSIVDKILEGKIIDDDLLQREIAHLYALTDAQYSHIEKTLSFLQKKVAIPGSKK